MGQEIDLMRHYPRSKRNVEQRGQEKSEADRALARQFGKAFFDGERSHGYGGFHYHSRFWEQVVPDFQKHFGIKAGDTLLDIGCAKGFMLYDLDRIIPGLKIHGIDVSEYAIENCKPEIAHALQVGSAVSLPFDDKSIDFTFSITTLHNLDLPQLTMALHEIERVTRKGSFITVDAYRNEEEKQRMEAWNLTAKTMMHVDEWKTYFQEVGYTGDYYWFIP